MEGVLLVRKPAGWTSFDVVARVRRLVADAQSQRPKSVKVGHSGTLDPFATGLLVLCVGKSYTKRISELTKKFKTYDVTMKLGMTSSTGDPEGTITHTSDLVPSAEALQNALILFTGVIPQTPPAYSAIKVDGQRAYKLARAGRVVSLPERMVTIRTISLTSYAYPNVIFTTNVSAGTYIRSLVQDIGKYLGTGAYTLALDRTRIGDFSVNDASDVSSLSAESISRQIRTL